MTTTKALPGFSPRPSTDPDAKPTPVGIFGLSQPPVEDREELQALGRGASTGRLMKLALDILQAAAQDAAVLQERMGWTVGERERLLGLYIAVREGAARQRELRRALAGAVKDRREAFDRARSYLRSVGTDAREIAVEHPEIARTLGAGGVEPRDPLATRFARLERALRLHPDLVVKAGIGEERITEGRSRRAILAAATNDRDRFRRELAECTAALLEARGRLVRGLRLLRLVAQLAFAKSPMRLKRYDLGRVRRRKS